MAYKNNLHFFIREYSTSDHDAVMSLFHDGVLEHVYPAFFKAMSHPDHIGVSLSISMAGYILGGSSYFQGLLFLSAWAGLVYYCCHEVYDGYRKSRLGTDMADTEAHFLDSPDSGMWVAEAEVDGRAKVAGVVAVSGNRGGEGGARGGRAGAWNGGVAARELGLDEEDGGHAELPHLVVSYSCRRKGLAGQLARKALEFCKEHGYSRVALDTSSPQAAALSLYQKLGFVQTSSHRNTHANRWISKLARIEVMRMEKVL
ncbi:N-acetyltransferase family 8 member 3 [Aplochiton taeniatus]